LEKKSIEATKLLLIALPAGKQGITQNQQHEAALFKHLKHQIPVKYNTTQSYL
jgi:hypothetical protein